jgi:hypothetical protein
MFGARKRLLILVTVILAFVFANAIHAAVTGKIQGVVVDKKTGEGLPSVAVVIAGTTQGVLTSIDGSYTILNVPPGMVSVQFRLQGFGTHQVDEVQVVTGRSTEVNAQLEQRVIESDLIVKVKAEKNVMEMNKPTSNVTISKEQMQAMPVTDVEQLIGTTVGVQRRYGELHIRGGRSGEVSYVIDGVETKDPLGGLGPTDAGMNLSSNTIEEIQIIKGGFDPEYGRAMSGIVTINTKTGTTNTEGHIELLTDNLRAPNLNKYSNNYDRLFFSLGGPEPFIGGKLLPALGVDYFKDKLFYFFALDTWRSDGDYAYNEYTSPTRMRDWREHSILGIDIRDRQRNWTSVTAKLTYKISNNMKALVNYQSIWDDRTIFRWDYRYTPSTAPIGNDLNERVSLQLTHQIDKSTFYEVLVSRVYHEYIQQPDDPSNPGTGVTPAKIPPSTQWEKFVDRNGNGVYDAPEPFINVYADTSYAYGGNQYNFGDIFEPTVIANDKDPSWELNQPYHLYDPWFADSVRYNEDIDPWSQGQATILAVYVDTLLWDWNHNGYVDFEEGEPFVDLNNNGRWDRGDQVTDDINGNGLYDEDLATVVSVDRAEPYIDGDISYGEPFQDRNNNGLFDPGIDLFVRSVEKNLNNDLNRNSKYDGPGDVWTPAIPFKDMNGNGIYDISNAIYDPGEPFSDLNGNGKWDGADKFLDKGLHDGTNTGTGEEDPHYHESSSDIWTADFKITKQLVKQHELKTGFQVRFLDLEYIEITNPWTLTDPALSAGGPWPDRGAVRDYYKHSPVEGALFFQDIIEYGSLIARVGLRYDFFLQSSGVDSLVDSYSASGQSLIDSRSKLSPRMGISYPITERAKIYFNYGHFYQLPQYVNMYKRLGQRSGKIGNPNLDFSKTVEYEFGVRYNLSGDYVLDVTGFYKDIFGIINTQKVAGSYDLYQQENSDYGRTRGFEIQLEKKYGNYVSGNMNYTYSFAYGKASSEISNYEALVANRDIPIQEYPLDWDLRHAISVNIDLRISRADHPKLFGYTIPNDWGLNVLWQWNSGYPFTPAASYPNLRLQPGERVLHNSMRLPASSSVDLKFNKNFAAFNVDYSIDLWVDNIFDNRNVETVYDDTGRWDTSNNQSGMVRGGSDYDQIPYYRSPGRNIRVGLTLNF